MATNPVEFAYLARFPLGRESFQCFRQCIHWKTCPVQQSYVPFIKVAERCSKGTLFYVSHALICVHYINKPTSLFFENPQGIHWNVIMISFHWLQYTSVFTNRRIREICLLGHLYTVFSLRLKHPSPLKILNQLHKTDMFGKAIHCIILCHFFIVFLCNTQEILSIANTTFYWNAHSGKLVQCWYITV